MEIQLIQIEKGKPVQHIVQVTKYNYWAVRKKLKSELLTISQILKILKEKGHIKCIGKPRNKKMQKYLNELIEAKCQIKDSIKKLIVLFS